MRSSSVLRHVEPHPPVFEGQKTALPPSPFLAARRCTRVPPLSLTPRHVGGAVQVLLKSSMSALQVQAQGGLGRVGETAAVRLSLDL